MAAVAAQTWGTSSARAAHVPRVGPVMVRAANVLHDDRHLVSIERDRSSRFVSAEATDVATNERRALPRPGPTCAPADLHDGQLLWTCFPTTSSEPPATGYVQDVDTGTLTALPTLPADLAEPDTSGGPSVGYSAIGRSWASVAISGYHYGYVVWQRRADGALLGQGTVRHLRGDEVADLDSPQLFERLCRHVRPPYVPDAFIDFEPGALAHVGPWWAGTGSDPEDEEGLTSRVLLQRCDRPRRVLDHVRTRGSDDVSDPALSEHWVAWTRETSADDRHNRSVVSIRRLRDGRTRVLRLATPSTPIAVGNRLYLVEQGRESRVRRVYLG